MGLGHYLFGFSGRINRAKQWAFLLVGIAIEIVGFLVYRATLGAHVIADLITGKTTLPQLLATPQAHLFAVVAGLLYLLLLFMSCAVATKRLHDRNKSAWWLAVFYLLPLLLNIPRLMVVWSAVHNMDGIAGTVHHGGMMFQGNPAAILAGGAGSIISLWAFVELFLLRGTAGDNRFGPDPLARRT